MEMRYVFASKQWYEQYDLEWKDLQGKSHYDIFPEILKMPEWLDIHKRVLNGETLERKKDRFIRANGSVQYQRWIMKPWYLPGTETQGGAFIFTEDITHQVELEDEKNHLIEKLTFEVMKRQAIEEKLRTLATTDELTALYNRRHISEILANEVDRAARYSNSLSLLIIDIDHFKSINDQHGHIVGDEVLQSFATLLMNLDRNTDKVGRWGGEKFMVVLPQTSADKALSFAERIRIKVAEADFPLQNNVTVSIGVATYVEGDTAFSLTQRADTALYDAKNTGRNQVVVGA